MSQLPDLPHRDDPSSTRLTPEQFEQVIRRAAELQARTVEEPAQGGISQAELLRIGREIGIAPQYLHQALAETTASSAVGSGLKERLFGPGWVVAARAVPGDSADVSEHLDQYLREREWLSVLRRLPSRTIYHKASGMDLVQLVSRAREALFGQTLEPQVGAGFKLRNARRVEVAVQPLEAGYSYVVLRVDLTNSRTGFATAGLVLGWGGAAGVAATLGIAIDPAAAVLGLPVAGGSMWGFRAVQGHIAEHAQTHLESILDCLERGERLVRARPPRG